MTVHRNTNFRPGCFARSNEEFTNSAKNGGVKIFGLLPLRINHTLSSRVAASIDCIAVVTASISFAIKEWQSGLQRLVAARLASLYVGGESFRRVPGRAMAVHSNRGPRGTAQKLVDGYSARLAQNIPECAVNRADCRAVKRPTYPKRIAIHLFPVVLDLCGVFAYQVLLQIQN